MIAISILLAATISTRNLDEFLTVPDWCPTSVSSAKTFGSPDNYVTMWSNDVYTAHWQVFRDGVDVTDVAGQPTWDAAESTWDVSEAIDTRDSEYGYHEYVPGEAEHQGGSEKDELLEYYSFLFNPFPPPGGEDTIHYTANADGWRTNRVRIGVAPNSSRLTPQWLAATYAPFAAWYERVYFTSERTADGVNSWTASGDFGDAAPIEDVMLGKPEDGTAGDGQKALWWYEPETNKAVRSLRLVEYDNLKRLCTAVCDMNSPSRSMTIGGRYYTPGSWQMRTFLSSTVLDRMFDYRDLPAFSWRSDPWNVFADENEWAKCAPHFGYVYNGPIVKWNDGGLPDMIVDLAFRTVDWDDYLQSNPDYYNRVTGAMDRQLVFSGTNTIEDVISYPFQAEGGTPLFAATNLVAVSRRLTMKSHAALDQALAVIDRSYGENFPTWEVDVVGETVRGTMRFESEPEYVEVEWNAGGSQSDDVITTGEVKYDVPLSFSVVTSYYTAVETKTTETFADYKLEVIHDYDDAYSYGSEDASPPSGRAYFTVSEMIRQMASILPEPTGGDPDVYTFYPLAIDYFVTDNIVFAIETFYIDSLLYTVQISAHNPIYLDNVMRSAWIEYTRGYSWRETDDGSLSSDSSLVNPGSSEAYGRCSSTMWSLLSLSFENAGESHVKTSFTLPYVNWENGYYNFLFQANKDAVGSVSAMKETFREDFRRIRQKCRERATQWLGGNFSTHASIIPLNATDMDEITGTFKVREGASVTVLPDLPSQSGNPVLTGYGEIIEVDVVIGTDIPTIAIVTVQHDDGTIEEVYASDDDVVDLGCVTFEIEGVGPDDDAEIHPSKHLYGFGAGGKFTTWTKNDWTWNTLRLNFED